MKAREKGLGERMMTADGSRVREPLGSPSLGKPARPMAGFSLQPRWGG